MVWNGINSIVLFPSYDIDAVIFRWLCSFSMSFVFLENLNSLYHSSGPFSCPGVCVLIWGLGLCDILSHFSVLCVVVDLELRLYGYIILLFRFQILVWRLYLLCFDARFTASSLCSIPLFQCMGECQSGNIVLNNVVIVLCQFHVSCWLYKHSS